VAEEIIVQFRLGDDGVKRDVEKIKRQIDTGLAPDSRHSANETKERQHQQRLERIHQQSAATLQTIEARKQAQLDVIRERAAQREIGRLKSLERSTRDVANSLASLGGKLTLGITAPLAALGIAAVKTATDFDSLKRGLTAVTKEAGPVEAQLARLKEVAKLPGLGFREAVQGSINLQAAGFSAKEAERALKGFGNALATVGKGKTELDGVILALTQIQSKGKVSAEEINQLAERVPQIRQIMLQAFGTADTEVIQRA
jgi:tape measure domain-containing protein